jgi:hypothetical protein
VVVVVVVVVSEKTAKPVESEKRERGEIQYVPPLTGFKS